ncbi:HD family phosphohydrolase [Evansella cellulosilytica]|uniref:7TM receptor with intracellular metal dependent phosphohydrolase n=1 Tax=Evansella cellulosilytica (strain ATCC 21833 / DSM 2522 / FERM P-1141 / JCM 9156 / N-4) TaxID=649639 RepID=E6TW43_EVAC2|nr:HD family phosphohydrolase [Evansella cellulosilytica]ADU29866.1 7TM receptor with intracellular metal dependent phosphohydrolase [Evansella cellulosilytica DSM 2522]
MGKRKPIDHQQWWQKIKDHRSIRFSLFILVGVITYALTVNNVIPETLEVSHGSVAEQDIRSPITIENKQETERLKQQAYESIEPIYSIKSMYAQNQVERINDIFYTIMQVQTEAREREEEIASIEAKIESLDEDEDAEELEDLVAPEEISIRDQLERVRNIINQQTSEDLSDETIETLLKASEEDLEIAQETTASVIHDVMAEEVHIDQVEEAKNEAERKVLISTVDPGLFRSMIELARFGITANYLLDEVATEEARQTAVDMIDPVMIREGQLLVEEGQMITSDIYNQLALVGLLDDHSNVFPYVGLAIIVLILISMLAYYLSDAKTTLQKNNTHLLMYVIIYTITLIILKLVSLANIIDVVGLTYIAPVAMGSMLITILLHSRVALFTAMILAIISSVMFNEQSAGVLDYTHGIYVFFSAVAGVFFLSKSHRTMRILQAGFFVGLLNVLVIIAFLLLKNAHYGWIEVSLSLGFAVLSGFIAAVLTLGFLPFLEAGFGVLSTTKLIELSNPNHPLLRKILLEAPGTYHHSVIVANLAEAACESVGENGLLARVGAYYHDLGKTKRPHFFIENQMKIDNPHDKISPQLSKTIIIAHPYDGAELLKEHRMPKEIIGIAEQHHGTTLLKYFYHKANQEADKEIPEEEFRYPGPKAQTRVAAIVGIADCVEAAVRSMNKPTPAKIEALVKKIITDRLEDGQFDECDITLKELNSIARSMCETLQGTFHTRIEYPNEEEEQEVKKEEGEGKHGGK